MDMPSTTTSGLLASGAEELHFPAGKAAGHRLMKEVVSDQRVLNGDHGGFY